MTDSNFDDICDRFDASWQAGQPLNIEDLLPSDDDRAREKLLRALLEIEVEYRIRGDETPSVGDYLERFPEYDGLLAEALAAAQRRVGSFPDEASTDVAAKRDGERRPARRVIGPYKLLQQIGEGGMGTVYMAEQTKPVRRRVALKVVKAGHDRQEFLNRFEAERQALAMMDHPNIAKVLDAGSTDDGRPFFVMELVHGIPITDYCDRHKLSLNDRLQLFIQACRAIQHAHQKGIMHRDVKPSNILVTQHDGEPVVKAIDFGLAKALQNSQRLTERTLFTEFGQVVGTLQYMSPEQSEMNALDVDTRSDVYSLGVLLYELLTGSTPITREKIKNEAFHSILALIRDEEAPRPSQRLSESGDAITGISQQRRVEPKQLSLILKGDLDWIAIKSLEKDRTRRYGTPAALADDVQRYLDDEVIEARPPSLGYRLGKSVRKHQREFVAATSIVILLVAAVVGTGTGWWSARNEEAKAKESQATAEEKAQGERRARKDAQNAQANALATLARSQYLLAIARWDAGRFSEARALLELVPWKHRDFAWRLAKHQFLGSDFISFEQIRFGAMSFSPDGEFLASGSQDGTIQLWHVPTGKELQSLKGHKGRVTSVCFSPDNSRVASGGGNGTIKLWNASTGEELRTLKAYKDSKSREADRPSDAFPWGDVNQLQQSDDGSFDFRNYNFVDNGQTNNINVAVNSVSFNQDATRLASGSEDGTIMLWDATTGKEIKTLKGHDGSVGVVSFSPDGTRLASGDEDREALPGPGWNWEGKIKLWDTATGKLLKTLEGHNRGVLSVSFSPDGKRLASGGRDGTINLWDAATGKSLRALEGHSVPYLESGAPNNESLAVNSLSFSPDGVRLASGSDNGIKLWDASTGEELRTLRGQSLFAKSVSFSPDGTRINSANAEGFRSWNASSEEEFGTLTVHHSDAAARTIFGPGGILAEGMDDGTIKLWDALTSEAPRILQGHSDGAECLSFSPDGARLATIGDEAIKVWNTSTGEELWSRKVDRVGDVVVFSSNGKTLAFLEGLDTIRLWDASTGEEQRTLKGQDCYFNSLSFSHDGNLLAAGGELTSLDGTIKIWDVLTGKEFKTLEVQSVACVSFSPNGTLASGGRQGMITLWNVPTGEELKRLTGHEFPVSCVCFSQEGTLASGSKDGTIKLWDEATGAELRTLKGHNNYVHSLSFRSDGTRLESGSDDGMIKFWDASTDEELRTLNGHNTRVASVSFSPDGTRLASGSDDGTVKLWDASTNEPQRTFKGHNDSVTSVSFSPDGKRFASGSDDETIKLWSATTGEELWTLTHNGSVTNVTFSSDGARLASGGYDGIIRLWDVLTGSELRSLTGHNSKVTCLQFNSDRTRLASGSYDGTMKLWDALTGEELWTRKGHDFEVTAVNFSPDGAHLLSSGRYVEVKKLWDASSGALLGDEAWREAEAWILSVRETNVSASGLLAVPSGAGIMLVNPNSRDLSREKAQRAFKAKPKPWWHKEQLAIAETAGNPFAATFHSAWLLTLEPQSQYAYDALHENYAQLTPDMAKRTAPMVTEALELPKPTDNRPRAGADGAAGQPPSSATDDCDLNNDDLSKPPADAHVPNPEAPGRDPKKQRAVRS